MLKPVHATVHYGTTTATTETFLYEQFY